MEGGIGHGQDHHGHDFLSDGNLSDFDPPNWGQSLIQGSQNQYNSYQPQQQIHVPPNPYSQQQYQVPQLPPSQPQPQYTQPQQQQYNNNNNNNNNPLQANAYQQAPTYSTPYAPQQYQQHVRPSNAFTAASSSASPSVFQPLGVDSSLHNRTAAAYSISHDPSYQYMTQPNRQATISPQLLHPNNLNPNPQLQPPNRAHSSSPFVQPGGQANAYVSVPQPNRAHSISPFRPHTSGTVNPSLYQQQTSGHANPFNPAPQLQQPNRAISSPSPYQSQVAGAVNTFYPTSQNGQYQLMYQTQQQATPIPRTSTQYQVIPNLNATTTSSAGFKRSFDHSTISSTPQVILPAYVAPQPQVETVLDPPEASLRVSHPDLLAEKEIRPKHPLEGSAQYVSVIDAASGMITEPEQKVTSTSTTRQKKSGAGTKLSGTEKPPPKKRGRPPKDKNITATQYKGTAKPPKILTVKKLREDGSIRNSPSASTNTSSSEEESSSEDESEDEEAMPIIQIESVRGPTRPTNFALAAKWDAIGIIWRDPHSSPTTEVLNDSMVKYINFVMDIKTQIKEISAKILAAAGNANEVTQLESRRTELFDALYHTIHVAVEYGFERTVILLGSSPKFVNALVQTLRECVQATDYGRLPKEILSLMAKFTTMSDALLQKVKFEHIQKRWNKRSDDDAKSDIAKIYANTLESRKKAEPKPLEEAKKARETSEQPDKKGKPEGVKATLSNAVKRPHEGDGTNGKPAKKFASDISGTPGPPAKIISVKKPTGNLLGISTRPAPKPVVKKREPSPPKESVLGALLASIAQPAAPPMAPLAPPRAPETPEEKTRRERKESRRHLRVKFKEGPELEQIRLFKHEQGEDEGRQDDMLRDANDTHNEGMMHKKRVSETIEDDDDYQPPDVEEAQFPEPRGVDFSQLDKSTRYGPIFTSRGGDLQFSTPEQKSQAHRETVELLVIYTDPSDIPPSAKEPPLNGEGANQSPPQQIPSPSEPWIVQRLQELNYYGPVESFRLFTSRHVTQEAPESRSKRISQAFQTPPPSKSATSFLQPQTNYDQIKTQVTDIKQASVMSDHEKYRQLQALIDTLKGKPFPPTEPPEWMANQNQRDIWVEGHHRDNAEKLNGEAEQRIQQAYQQHVPAPQFNQPPFIQQYQSVPQQATHDYTTGNSNKNAAISQTFDYNAWAAANMGHRASENSRPLRREEPDLPRRERDDRFQGNFKSKNYQQDGSWGGDQSGAYKYKKEPCTYYPLGRCAKGDACTYVHE